MFAVEAHMFSPIFITYIHLYNRKLLTVDPAKRLTVQQAIAHPWLGKTPEELAKFNLESNLAALRKFQVRYTTVHVHMCIISDSFCGGWTSCSTLCWNFDINLCSFEVTLHLTTNSTLSCHHRSTASCVRLCTPSSLRTA